MQGGLHERQGRHRPCASATGVLAGLLVLALAAWPAMVGGAPPPAVARAADTDLSGVWEVRIDARTDPGFPCGLVPDLVESYVDTVRSAHSLAELVTAVVPDSLAAAFDGYCRVLPAGHTQAAVAVHCDIPLVLAAPCSLRVAFEVVTVLAGADSVSGGGRATATLHGSGFCPRARCPGSIVLVLERTAAIGRDGP
ncbi:MAG: hypothetical protein PVF43_12140 [Candidatus Eiseniibacteriota bacterium]